VLCPCDAVGHRSIALGLAGRQEPPGAAFTGLTRPTPGRGMKPLSGALGRILAPAPMAVSLEPGNVAEIGHARRTKAKVQRGAYNRPTGRIAFLALPIRLQRSRAVLPVSAFRFSEIEFQCGNSKPSPGRVTKPNDGVTSDEIARRCLLHHCCAGNTDIGLNWPEFDVLLHRQVTQPLPPPCSLRSHGAGSVWWR